MADSPVVTGPTAVEHALHRPELVPHGTTDPSDGSTIRLRRAMARFSGPSDHPERRARVDAAVRTLDADDAERVAWAVTSDLLRAGASLDAVVRSAPTVTLVSLLGLPSPAEGGVSALVDDVEAVVRVIGRGDPADPASDAATDRLLAARNDPADAVAVVSLLYQNFDATSALLRTTMAARATGAVPEPAVRVTRRVATAPIDLGDTALTVGDEVVLDIAGAGLPFGAGPHACPGRELAEAIVRGVLAALDGAAPS
jgi:hypothetical protein